MKVVFLDHITLVFFGELEENKHQKRWLQKYKQNKQQKTKKKEQENKIIVVLLTTQSLISIL